MANVNYTGIAGSALLIAGGFSPLLRVPILGNWNYWDIDLVLASLIYCFATLGMLAAIQDKRGLLRFSGWASLFMIAFTLTAIYFKVNDAFSFIPMKKLASAAARLIHYKWLGWGILSAGALLLLIAGRKKALAVPSPEAASASLRK